MEVKILRVNAIKFLKAVRGKAPKIAIERVTIEDGQSGGLCGRQLLRNVPDQLFEPVATELLIFDPHRSRSYPGQSPNQKPNDIMTL